MFEDQTVIDQIVRIYLRSIRFYVTFAAILVLVGLTIIMTGRILAGQWLVGEAFKGYIGLGGGCVAALSAFPVKEVLLRREKIQVILLIQTRRSTIHNSRRNADKTERERIDALLWQLLEKTVTG